MDRDMISNALVYAAATGTSLHGACQTLDELADDTTMRDHLTKAFPGSAAFEVNKRVKRMIGESARKAISKCPREIAIDTKDFPYYGRADSEGTSLSAWICRRQAKSGTTRFLTIATAYVMHQGQRVTLASMQVSKGMTQGEIVRELIGHLRPMGIKIKRLYLDRGFASVEVIKVIERMRLSAVIACPIRGGEKSGVRQYCKGKGTNRALHTFKSSKHGTVSVPVAVVRTHNGGNKANRKPRKWTWLIYIMVGVCLDTKDVRNAYRRRFGVETSYRVLNQIRPRTTSRNPSIRILLIGIGILLSNLWVALKQRVCRKKLPPHGFRKTEVIEYEDYRLPLLRIKIFLQRAIEQLYSPLLAVPLSPDSI